MYPNIISLHKTQTSILMFIRNYHSHEPLNNHLVQLLQKYPKLESVDATKSLHALSITMGSNSAQPIFVKNNIIRMYVLLGHLSDACKVFDEMPERNIVSYNTMIRAHCCKENVEGAWNIFLEMKNYGLKPNQFTFGSLLSCSSLNLFRGFYLQGLMVKSGFYHDAFSGTALLGMLGRHGFLDDAVQVFDEMPTKTLVTWNLMISLLGQNGLMDESFSLFRKLVSAEYALSEETLIRVLSVFVNEQDLGIVEQVHALVIKRGFDFEVSVSNSLISTYSKCCSLPSAEKLFKGSHFRDIVTWNTIIGAQAESDKPEKSLQLLFEMYTKSILPNKTTFLSAIKCCSTLRIPMYGTYLHAKIIKNIFETDLYIGSALVDFYAKCDRLQDSHRCFDEINYKSLVSWNSLILAYSKRGCSSCILKEMIELGYRPNEVSLSIAATSSCIVEIKQLHSMIIKMGYHQNDYVFNSLTTSYAKTGFVYDASLLATSTEMPPLTIPSNVIASVYNKTCQYHKTQELISSLDKPDSVSWNILLNACCRSGDYSKVFKLFKQMLISQIKPDNHTYVSLLSGCTKLCNLRLGSSLHTLIIKSDFTLCDTFVCNILIDMYAKCGSLESSMKIFNETRNRNVISWTSFISALGLHGYGYEALDQFRQMEMQGLKPDRVTLISVLSACRHVGLVKEGMELFENIKSKYGFEPDIDHYVISVDLLVRNSQLKKAERLISCMPFPPNATIWRSFLEGCKKQRAIEDLEQVSLDSKKI